MPSPPWISVARLWDDGAHTARRQREGVHLRLVRSPIHVHLEKRNHDGWTGLVSRHYQPSGVPGIRNLVALDLFEQSRASLRRPLLLLSAPYFSAQKLLSSVRARNSAIGASVPPRLVPQLLNVDDWKFLRSAKWRESERLMGAPLGAITLGSLEGWLYAFDSEKIHLPRRGTKFVAYFGSRVDASTLGQVVWCSRKLSRTAWAGDGGISKRRTSSVMMPVQRPNMALAIRQDAKLGPYGAATEVDRPKANRIIRFADMFAGAGGLSLGFLLADGATYELCAALDVSKICTTTLTRNFVSLSKRSEVTGRVCSDAIGLVDLGERKSLDALLLNLQAGQGIDVVVGGPPCQPFSSARRRPASQSEARLLNCFCEVLERLQPSVLLLENVQGILWKDASGVAPAQRFVERLLSMGYRVASKVLDAAWYGAGTA